MLNNQKTLYPSDNFWSSIKDYHGALICPQKHIFHFHFNFFLENWKIHWLCENYSYFSTWIALCGWSTVIIHYCRWKMIGDSRLWIMLLCCALYDNSIISKKILRHYFLFFSSYLSNLLIVPLTPIIGNEDD